MADILTQPNYVDRLQEMDKAIRDWSKATKGHLRQRLIALDLDARRASKRGGSRLRRKITITGKQVLVQDKFLIESLRASLKRRGLVVESVGFQFARHGIFLEIGVGKNRRKGSGKESPQEWIKPVLPKAIDELADILSNQYADIAAGELKISIPGIYSTKISI
jgi:hypothetical protein